MYFCVSVLVWLPAYQLLFYLASLGCPFVSFSVFFSFFVFVRREVHMYILHYELAPVLKSDFRIKSITDEKDRIQGGRGGEGGGRGA